MKSFSQRLLNLFETIHPLDRIGRAGFVLRGVPEPETIAAHSHFLAVMTLLFVDEYPEDFDRGKALAIALTHDLCEAQLMDIPMPAADAYLREAKTKAEQAITEDMLDPFHARYGQYHQELTEASTPEAKLVRGLDKAQMMIKILMYEREGKGRLAEFWHNPKNFADFGIEPVADLFDAICNEAGRPKPQ
ncbi:MAG: oxetanocin [Candidatus Hydrogenedentota bacterium]|nr:MAG: oxetanocin [Candidatus Hydrogenedentota bacterium]